MFLYFIKQIDSMLPRNRSHKTSKYGKNRSDTLCYRFVSHFFVLTTVCDLLLNTCMATWNLFVKYIYLLKCHSKSYHGLGLGQGQ